ncbi:adenosylcobinamide-GDP ribazoletransferase [Brevundimonas terrae]|uniref:Adenosylcobinamide-GDP ribazoletransferase n=1 Tax=Brevundimonas terrae TaxID=363631 RepID=A0ABP3IFB3_9CAUL|nr:adenosylcobinamide-GDP ribazoletransferase [Brevundimonas terrae]NIJ27442.1 adenosylcobinamide-GDP ribazoletransferase [Brevundimonas terrae]
MIRRELKLIICAVQFLTRIPTPQLKQFDPAWIQASARYYPLVGLLVGTLSAAVLWGASQLVSPLVAALLAIAASMALTGCFHEDGLADTADGIGGGSTRERRLEIMKDSRLGTYGASVLFLNLMIRAGCLAALIAVSPVLAAIAMICAQSFGRSAAVTAMAIMPYGGNPGMAKEGKPDRTGAHNVIIAVLIGLAPFAMLTPVMAGAGLGLGLLAAAIPALLAWKHLGGRTGDVLGAVEQSFEIGFLLALGAIIRL